MKKISYMKNALRFNADMEEAMDYIPAATCFKNRRGQRIEKMWHYEKEDIEIGDYIRSSKRRAAHNGEDVPSKYISKPKSKDIVRETIRHTVLNDEALNEEYAREYYAAAGMC